MIYERIAYFLPKKYKGGLKQTLVYAGFEKKETEKIIGFAALFSLSIGLVAFFLATLMSFGALAIGIGMLSAAASLALIHLAFIMIADSRGREIENVLPDCLQLISSNIRAGMTVDKAVWLSARKEFGILEEEIRKVGAKTFGGKPIKFALQDMTTSIKSTILERTIKLIVEGMESGGELAKLMDETATNIRTQQTLRKEIYGSVMMYTLFIGFAAVLGAPLLFAISIYFIEITSNLWALQGAPATGGAGGMSFLKVSGPQIPAGDLLIFSLITIAITTFFGSLIIGLIQYGQEKRGLKYVPLFMGAAFAIFFAANFLIRMLFGGMIKI
ncbi:MAG: type II secretion system F family protein [Nanoarchaeota archaeon]|nr:type II secretion system F family protein [Nanoarchaeota archaeon]